MTMPPDDARPTTTDQLRRQLEERTSELHERAKELDCLYRVTHLLYAQSINFSNTLQSVVDTLPRGLQYPEIAYARLVIGGHVYETANYEPSPWRLTTPFSMPDGPGGVLVMGYLERRHAANEGPFLAEERALIDAVASHIQIAVQSRHTQAALRESEARFRRLAENAPDAIFIYRFQPTPHFEYVSPAVEQIAGYPPQALYENPYLVAEIAHPDSRDVIEELMQGNWPGNDFTIQLYHKDGSLIRLGVRVSDIRDSNGDIVAVEGIARDVTEVHEMGEALRESEIRYRRLIETIHEGIWVVDREQRATFINECFANMLGYEPEEMLGRYVTDFLDDSEYDRVPSDLSRVKWINRQFDVKLRHKSGSTVWALMSVAPIYEDGKLLGALGTVNNITSRKMTEQTEREQRILAETLRAVAAALNSTLDPHEVFDLILANLNRVVPSDTANIMLIEGDQARIVGMRGYEDKDGTPKRLAEVSYSISEVPGLRRMVETKQPLFYMDTTTTDQWVTVLGIEWIRSYVGAPIVIEDEVIGFINADSDTPGHFTIEDAQRLHTFAHHAAIAIRNARLHNQLAQHNVSLQQAIEMATSELRQTVEQLEAILNSSPSAIIMLREGMIVASINPAFTNLFGYGEDEVYGKPLYHLFGEPTRSELRDAAHRIVQGEDTIRLEVGAHRRDGTRFDASIALGVVEQNDELIGIVCNVWDVSAFKEIERMKDSIIGTAAHELRTPLTSVQGYSEILLTRELNQEARRRYLTLINQQAVQLARIISSLLDISLLESGKGIQFNPLPIDPGDVIDKALMSFTAASPYHDIQVEKQYGDACVRGDMTRLTQVVTNLVSNAIKYSPEGGRVRVRAEARGDNLVISVADEGIGMSAEQQERVFERFYRVDMSNTAVEGAGLGLSIVRLIVDAHGGRIEVKSEPGNGSTFTVILPQADLIE